MPIPALNIIAIHELVRNSGRSSSWPRRRCPKREQARNATRIKKAAVDSTNSQPRFFRTQSSTFPTTLASSSWNSTPTSTNATDSPAAIAKTGTSIFRLCSCIPRSPLVPPAASGARAEHRDPLGLVAGRDPSPANHAIGDHVVEPVQRLLESIAQAAAGEWRGLEPELDALDDLDVLAVDRVPEPRQVVDPVLGGGGLGMREQVGALPRRPRPARVRQDHEQVVGQHVERDVGEKPQEARARGV